MTHGADPRGRAITRTVVIIGFVLLAAVFFLLIFSAPVEDPSRVTIGFSLNSFFVWLGGLHPLAQIPVILLVFALVVGGLLTVGFVVFRGGRRARARRAEWTAAAEPGREEARRDRSG